MLATSDVAVFAGVVFLVVGVGLVGAVAAGLRGRGAYDRIGGGGPDVGTRPDADADAAAEIAQLEDALRRRRAARGVDATVQSPVDPGLEEELRQLAHARNARRARAGLDPLDVEAEVARRIRADPER